MSTHWNYRVIRQTNPDGGFFHSIHEVYYGDDGHPHSYTEDAISPMGESLLDLSVEVDSFVLALSKPVLIMEDFFPVANSQHVRDVELLAVDRPGLNADIHDWMDLFVAKPFTTTESSFTTKLSETSGSADELIGKLNRFIEVSAEDALRFNPDAPSEPEPFEPPPLKVFPVPSDRPSSTGPSDVSSDWEKFNSEP